VITVWTQEQTPTAGMKDGTHSHIPAVKRRGVVPQSAYTEVTRRGHSTINPHNCYEESLHHCQSTQRLKGRTLQAHHNRKRGRTLRVTIAGAKGGPHPKGSTLQQQEVRGRTLRVQHSNSKRCRTLVTPQQRGHKRPIYHSKGP
jgi:hypothetical protein